MPITLVTTVKSATANSYATETEVDAHALATAWAASWAALTAGTDTKLALIVRAARALDCIAFAGVPTEDTVQALQWPRMRVYSPDGNVFDSDIIPPQIKRAQSQIAAYLSSFASTADPFSVDDTAKLEALDVGAISLRFRHSIGPDGSRFLATVIAPLLRPWGFLGVAGVVRLTR